MTEGRVRLALPDDPDATARAGQRVGSALQPGQTVALTGPMGAGKTTFVRGLAAGLRVDEPDEVSSPTYLLVVEHDGPTPLLHADAYLPAKLAGFLEDGGLEYLFDPAKVVCVEWAERVRNLLPENTLWVSLDHVEGGGRCLEVWADRPGEFSWIRDLRTMGRSE